ncbi:antibiotic biosynthesis monooxygenase [Flammeovirga sp. EKP202]|uniref:antibiotic biosynthesis monooxygenase family protein n=1 Tax=Flammeovirga sp. EKP202 TaxID=2770592 RepID=UPI00165F91E4|nr:antibiotic biosynthesis monooxygenase [Flammeovirga sp. EKP202]MBD0404851.1 hypothetical protein [Flammeovirga sp. EKP202]
MQNDIKFWSFLKIKALNVTAEKAAELHTKRHCIEECAKTIEGFIDGETLLSEDDPSLIQVVCGWTGREAYEEWLKSPVREQQLKDLVNKIEVESEEQTFSSYHKINLGLISTL